MAKRKSSQGLDTKDLVAGALGVLPIPIVGEMALSSFFYNILSNSNQRVMKPVAGIPAALLTRFVLYQEFYIPLYEKLFN